MKRFPLCLNHKNINPCVPNSEYFPLTEDAIDWKFQLLSP